MDFTQPESAASPREITLGGRKLLLRPLTDQDFGELTYWLKQKVKDAAAEFAKGMEPESRAIILNEAAKKYRDMDLMSPDAVPLLTSREGASQLVWMSLRKDAPDVTPEMIRGWLVDMRRVDEAMNAFDELNQLPKGAVTEGGKGSKKKKGR